VEEIRQALFETKLEICVTGDDDVNGRGNGRGANSRYLVRLSQRNDTVQEVILFLQKDYHHGYAVLECLGNLRALRVLTIFRYKDSDEYCEPDEIVFWDTFAVALGRVQHHIELRLDGDSWAFFERFSDFTKALQGVSTIQTFHSGHVVPLFRADILMSALASLPSLETVILGTFASAKPIRGGAFRGLTIFFFRRP
jgi:hypothetical protein